MRRSAHSTFSRRDVWAPLDECLWPRSELWRTWEQTGVRGDVVISDGRGPQEKAGGEGLALSVQGTLQTIVCSGFQHPLRFRFQPRLKRVR
jgi:hypothetical protein